MDRRGGGIDNLGKLKNKFQITLTICGNIEDENYKKQCEVLIEDNMVVHWEGGIAHEEIVNILQENHFLILPTFGENFGHAIFESFAAGRPVIISDQTPWQNLEKQRIGWDIALDNQQKWIAAIEDAINMEQQEFDIWCQSSW